LAQSLLYRDVKQNRIDFPHLPNLRESRKGGRKMKKMCLVLVVVGLGFVLMAGGAFAANDTKPLTVNATVSARATLTMGASSISFADADPDATSSIASSPASVSVTAKVRTGSSSTATLTHQAADDLKNASNDVIPIGNVTWTASGTGFQAGTMSKSAPVTAASWTGSGSHTDGSFSYFLANSWNYATGSYSATSTYTLTAP
jgi:hypothetical protein